MARLFASVAPEVKMTSAGDGAGQRRNLLGDARHFLTGGFASRVYRVRVGRESAFHIAESLQHRRVSGGMGGIIEINHSMDSSK